jgi:hypothetical protein
MRGCLGDGASWFVGLFRREQVRIQQSMPDVDMPFLAQQLNDEQMANHFSK